MRGPNDGPLVRPSERPSEESVDEQLCGSESGFEASMELEGSGGWLCAPVRAWHHATATPPLSPPDSPTTCERTGSQADTQKGKK